MGLIELLTIVAVLIVLLALSVATARHVRSRSANELTRKRLAALVAETDRLMRSGLDPTLPVPAELDAAARRLADGPAGATAAEPQLQRFARDAGEHLLAVFTDAARRPFAASTRAASGELAAPDLSTVAALASGGVPETRDAWGRPIALMPRQLPGVGIAPDNAPFFVSAGPDGAFATLGDNLYSYDLPALLPPPQPPAGREGVGRGGVDSANSGVQPPDRPAAATQPARGPLPPPHEPRERSP